MKTTICLKSKSNSAIDRIDTDTLTISDMLKLQSILTEALSNGLEEATMQENSNRLAGAYESAIKTANVQQKNLQNIKRLWG